MIATTTTPGPSAIAIAAPFIGVGALFATIGVAILTRKHQFRRSAEVARGTIVAMQAMASYAAGPGSAGITYRPTVRFATRSGQSIEAKTRYGTNPRPGRVGEEVVVLYNPKKPTHFTTTKMSRRTGCMASVFVMFGAVFAAVGLLLFMLIKP